MKPKRFSHFQVFQKCRLLALAAVSSLALLLSVPWAAGASSANKNGAKQDVVDQLRFRPDEDNESRAVQTEILVSVSEEKAIQQLKRIIGMRKGTGVEPDLHFRLAELYMRRSKTTRFFELSEAGDGLGRSTQPTLVKNKSTRGYLQQAIAVYEQIEKKFPRYSQMDAVVFNKAFAYQQLGREALAEQGYRLVTSRFTDSPLVADSLLALGEMAFVQKKYDTALEKFLEVKKYPNSRVYPYALYKAAWAHYNLHNAAAALRELEEVVAFGRKVRAEGLDSRLDLRREALADMTVFFEDVLSAEEAVPYFRKWASQEEIGDVLLRLAALYQRHGKRQAERKVLESFIAKFPTHEVRPKAHDSLVWSYEGDTKREEALRELQAFHEVCKEKSSWSKAQARNRAESQARDNEQSPQPKFTASRQAEPTPPGQTLPATCRDEVDETALKLANKWQRLWAKNPSIGLFSQISKAAFEIYLFEKPEDDSVNRARFDFGELLFKRQEYRAAAMQYVIVGKTSQDPVLRHDGGYGALVSLEKAVGDVWSDADEKLFQEWARSYVTRNPKGQYVVDIEFKMAFIAYEKKRYDEAAPRLKKLGWAFPDNPKGLRAQDLYLDILNLRKDYAQLRGEVSELRRLAKNPERHSVLTRIYQEAYFAEIQQYEEQGKTQQAIAEYQKFAKENPQSPLATGAIWNVAQIHEKAQQHQAFAEAMAKFAEQFPKDKRAKDALVLAAKRFQDLGEIEKATLCVDRLVSLDEEKSAYWLRLSMEFNFVTGQKSQARGHAERLRKMLKGTELHSFLKQWAESEQQFGDAATHQKLVAELADLGYEPFRSQVQLARLNDLFEKGHDAQAFALAKDLVGSKSAESKIRARARLIQARILEKEFRAQSVKAKVDRIALVLAIKTEKLAKAQEAYQAAMRFADPRVNVEALRQLSGCFEHYVTALRAIRLEESVSVADRKVFANEIESLVVPMEEKAVESMAQAVQQAEKARFFDKTASDLRQELKRLNMQSDRISEIQVQSPDIAVPQFSGESV